jgi:replicative DNA helicase
VGSGDRKDRKDRRVLPHNLDAEASILGGILLRNDVLAMLDILEVDDFYDLRHKIVFEAIRALEAGARPVDIVTLENEIQKRGKLDAIGGIAFLGELALRVPTPDNVEAYAADVIDYRVQRDVMLKLSEVVESGYDGEKAGEALIHDANQVLMTIRTGKETPVRTMRDLALEEARLVVADCEARSRGELVYPGVPTGIVSIDERCGGNPIGIMTLVIARPATGKTTFAMAFAESAKRIADMDSLLVSYEDGDSSFGQRAIAQETGIPTERLRSRKLDPMELDLVRRFIEEREALQRARRTEFFLDGGGLEVEQLVRRVRREQMKRLALGRKPLRQLIVDYIQKMPIPKWARSRDEGIGHISRVLSTFAKTDKLAVVVMCQLNREAERRDDHRPRCSDIRDSGSLEQDGKMIYGVYYPYGYERKNNNPWDVSLLLLKNAQGESLLEEKLYWDRPTHSIYNSVIDYQQARHMRGQ